MKNFRSSPAVHLATANIEQFQCPNCWGRQQWNNEYLPAQQLLSKVPPKAASARDGFIRKFMLKYLK